MKKRAILIKKLEDQDEEKPSGDKTDFSEYGIEIIEDDTTTASSTEKEEYVSDSKNVDVGDLMS